MIEPAKVDEKISGRSRKVRVKPFVGEDRRGRHSPANKASDVAIQRVDRSDVAIQRVDRSDVAIQRVDRSDVAIQRVDRSDVAIQRIRLVMWPYSE